MSRRDIWTRLNQLHREKNTEVLNNGKWVILSDLHLGDGGPADDFKHNEKVMSKALDYYYKENYSVIMLGDECELWQFDYKDVFQVDSPLAYERVLIDAMKSDLSLFARKDGIETMWEIVDPIIKALKTKTPCPL